jgi:tRNA pseudouridine55 synthase
MSVLPDEGLVILIDKELHWTSFDVVKKIRRLLNVKKVGHAGTLDPLATGLLIVCAGKMTKQINSFMDLEKEYTGTMLLGKTTPSVDLETNFDSEKPIANISHSQITGLVGKFTGEIWQKPPLFSAIKKDGSPLYLKARKGEDVKIEARPVFVKAFEITAMPLPEIHFRLVCSKGFYVRSLVRDFGDTLGVGACLTALKRTRIGKYKIGDAQTVNQFEISMAEGAS